MGLTQTLLGLVVLAVCHCSTHRQEIPRYHDLLKQGFSKLVTRESDQNVLDRYDVRTLIQRMVSAEALLSRKETGLDLSAAKISEPCSVGVKLLEDGLQQRSLWAIKMLDSFFKIPSGVLDGDIIWPGQYDECIKINQAFNDRLTYNMTFLIHGKYFLAGLQIPVDLIKTNVSMRVGLCLPDVCDEADVRELLEYYLGILFTNMTSKYEVKSVSHPETKFERTPEFIIASVICSVVGFLLLVGTLYDMFIYQRPEHSDIVRGRFNKPDIEPPILNSDTAHLLSDSSQGTLIHRVLHNRKLGKFLLTFSISTNGGKVLSTEAPPPTSVQAVNGVRVLSMSWVILGHTYIFLISSIKNLIPVAPELIHRWTFQIVLNAIFSVDSFFLLSGLLVSYLTLHELEKRNGKINWLLFYFHRFWRLTPPLMLVLLVYTAYFQYWGSGPLWPPRSPDHDQCSQYWWRNLLYIQNFFPLSEECVAWGWYLANDMQFYIISPLLIYPLYRKPLIGYIICFALVLMQAIYRGIISVNLKMTMNSSTNQEKFFDELYQRPYARIAPYVVGVLTGFFIWKSRRQVRMPKCVALLGWVIALGCVSAVIFGTTHENSGHKNPLSVDALYNSLSVLTWSLGLAWIIFACNTGYGGFINTFLSAGIWSPLSRLTYCAYLVHPVIMFMYSLCQRYTLYATDINMIFLFLGFWMCTYGIAFFVSMAFEAPMIGLERLLLKQKSS